MNHMTSETLPDEPISFRPMLESLEPRRLLSVAMPVPVISFAEFSFGGSGSPSSAPAVHAEFRQFVSPPLGARRIVETFESPFGDRSFSVTFFVTPYTMQNSTSTNNSPPSTPAPTTSTPTDPKQTPNTPSDAKSEPTEPITTFAIDDTTHSTGALPSTNPQTDAAAFATNVVEDIDATPHATNVKRKDETTARSSETSPLEQLQRDDELIETNAHNPAPTHAWYQVLDRDVLRQEHRTAEGNALANDRSEIITRPADQAESLRTLALRKANEQSLVRTMQPVTASVESTPVSIWERVAMVTLTGGALVANWYVRRRRAKLALKGFEKAGSNPYLP
jgi:hypothetical protein